MLKNSIRLILRSATNQQKGQPSHLTSDIRYQTMKRLLFQEEPRQLPALSWEDMERHRAILRAQRIHQLEARQALYDRRQRKYRAMELAYQELEQLDRRLYEAACTKESNLTFPRQLRVPTETPPLKIWDYIK